MEGKPVFASALFDYDLVIDPDYLRLDGSLLEGRFMQIVTSVAMMVASRHAECVCIAVGIDSLRFRKKVYRGDKLRCHASVNRTWRSTLEVGIKVVADDFRSLDQKEVFSAYFTFAAVDDDCQPVEIVPVVPESQEQIKRFTEAGIRHQRQREEDPGLPLVC